MHPMTRNLTSPERGRFRTMRVKTLSTLVILSSALLASTANAAVVTYADQASFEAAVTDVVTDTFEEPEYQFINSAADMQALSNGNIGYESTYFAEPNWNIVVSGNLCWGCNGSGQVLLDETTLGTSDGVFGFAADIQVNQNDGVYAFVTFGDGTTENFLLDSGPSYFALTADELIASVHFGGLDGAPATSGEMDQLQLGSVSIGSGGEVHSVPELDPGAFGGALALLLGTMAIVSDRRRQRPLLKQ